MESEAGGAVMGREIKRDPPPPPSPPRPVEVEQTGLVRGDRRASGPDWSTVAWLLWAAALCGAVGLAVTAFRYAVRSVVG